MIGIGTDSARRIARVVRRDEQRPYNEVGAGSDSDGGPELHPVKITSTTQTGGRYPGTLYQRDGSHSANSFAAVYTQLSSADAIWVDTPNQETLSTSLYYYAKRCGVATDGKTIFDVIGPIGSIGCHYRAGISVAWGGGTLMNWTTRTTYYDDGFFDSTTPNWIDLPFAGRYHLNVSVDWDISEASAVGFIRVKCPNNGAFLDIMDTAYSGPNSADVALYGLRQNLSHDVAVFDSQKIQIELGQRTASLTSKNATVDFSVHRI